VRLGRSGMEKILTYDLDDEERAAFNRSAESVRETIKALKI